MMVYHANMVSNFLATAGVPNIVVGTSKGSFLGRATELSLESIALLDFNDLTQDALVDALLNPVLRLLDPTGMFDLGGIAGHEGNKLDSLTGELFRSLADVGTMSHEPITYKQLWHIADEHQSSIETYQRSGDLAMTGLAKHIIPSGDHTEGDSYGTCLMFEKMVRKALGNRVELFGELPEDYEQTHAWHGKPIQAGGPVPEAGSARTNMVARLKDSADLTRRTLNSVLVHLIATGRALAYSGGKYISYLLPSYSSGEIDDFVILTLLYNHEQDAFSLVPYDVAQANIPDGYRFGLSYIEAEVYISANRAAMLDLSGRSCAAELADIESPRREVTEAAYRKDTRDEANYWDNIDDDIGQEFVDNGQADPSWLGHIAMSLTLLSEGKPSGHDVMQPSIIGDTSLAHAPYLKVLAL